MNNLYLYANDGTLIRSVAYNKISKGIALLGFKPGRLNKTLTESGFHKYTRGPNAGNIITTQIGSTAPPRPPHVRRARRRHISPTDTRPFYLAKYNSEGVCIDSITANKLTPGLRRLGFRPGKLNRDLIQHGRYSYRRGGNKGMTITMTRKEPTAEMEGIIEEMERIAEEVKEFEDTLQNQLKIQWQNYGDDLVFKIIDGAADTYVNSTSNYIYIGNKIDKETMIALLWDIQVDEFNSNTGTLVIALLTIKTASKQTKRLQLVLSGENWITRTKKALEDKYEERGVGSDVELLEECAMIISVQFENAVGYLQHAHVEMNDEQLAEFQKRKSSRIKKIPIEGADVDTPKESQRTTREGEFFPYFNTNPTIDLSEQQIFKKNEFDASKYEINCLLYAIVKSGKCSKKVIAEMSLRFIRRNVPFKEVNAIAKTFGLHFLINQKYGDNKTKTYHMNKKCAGQKTTIKLGLIANHWFLNTTLNAYHSFIKHAEYLPIRHNNQNKFTKGTWKHDKTTKKITAFRAINLMIEERQFKPFDSHQMEKIGRFKPADKVELLAYSDYCTKPITYKERNATFKIGKGKTEKEIIPKIFFADFETTTDEKFKEFAASAISEDGKTRFSHYGRGCTVKLLEWLPPNSYVLFHNLTFDINFIIRELTGTKSIMKNGSQIKRFEGIYKGKIILFIDSFLYINTKLANFKNWFPNDISDETTKEIFPYDFFSEKRAFESRIVYPIEEVTKYVKPEDVDEFVANPLNAKGFDKHAYTKYYCNRDVEVLRLGFNAFRRGMREISEITKEELEKQNSKNEAQYYERNPDTKKEWEGAMHNRNIDPLAYVSLASFADAFLKRDGCYNGTYELSGPPRAFIQKVNLGGRVMIANNEMKVVDNGKRITDNDATSLYPSGMTLLNTVLIGKPKILSADMIDSMNKNQDTHLEAMTETFLEIEIIDYGKDLRFPLIYERTDRINYINENTKMFVSGRYLGEIQKYHGATFKIARGYYFDNGYNQQIKTSMKKLFDARVEKKKERNPIQVLYKLIMNASYGINGLKFMDSKFVVLNTKQATVFLRKNASMINYFTVIENKRDAKLNKVIFNTSKTSASHFNRVHISASILDASKVIMNRVFHAADEANVEIFYQDTDSMQCYEEDIIKIEDKFAELYPELEQLRGNNMGQFHPDYEIDGCKDVVGIRGIFLAKKVYMIELEGTNIKTGEIVKANHIRMKSIPSGCILSTAEDAKITPYDIYMNLYNGDEYEFNLSNNGLKLEKGRDFTVKRITDFTRTICFRKGYKNECDRLSSFEY